MSKSIIEEQHLGILKIHNNDDGVMFTIEVGEVKQYI